MKIAALIQHMPSFLFENLDIYKKSSNLCGKIIELCSGFPNGNYFLADQLKRASLSIVANIAEGSGRQYPKDKKIFYYISRGSLFECVAILDVCRKNRLFNIELYDQLKQELTEISKMLTRLIQSF